MRKKIKKRNKSGKLVEITQKESEKTEGILLITENIFVGKDKPYEIINEDEELKEQVYKESRCHDGICLAHIILGVNLFDDELNIKNLNIKDFEQTLNKNDNIILKLIIIRVNNSILKIYYFYGFKWKYITCEQISYKKIIKDSQK